MSSQLTDAYDDDVRVVDSPNERAYQDLGTAADLMMPWSASALLDEGQQLSLRGAVDRVLEILAALSGGLADE